MKNTTSNNYKLFLSCRERYRFFEKSCLEILNKARYRHYPVDFSILSDFTDDDLEGLMDLGTKYSNQGSYAEAVDFTTDQNSVEIHPRNYCNGFEDYSRSNATATSWATAVITAAEYSYKENKHSEIHFSLKHLLTCLPRSCETEPNKITNFDIIRFVSEEGLISEDDEQYLNDDNLCTDTLSTKYLFEVTQIDVPNKGGLKRLIAGGNPVITLLALDLFRLRVANNVTGDYIFTGAAYNPSVYGVMLGYDEEKWNVTFNVVPCENIILQLPMTENENNANYAGIAGLAFSMSFAESTTPEPPDDPTKVLVTLIVNYGSTPTGNTGKIELYDAPGTNLLFSMDLGGLNNERVGKELDSHLMKIIVTGGPWSPDATLTIMSNFGSKEIDLSTTEIYFHPETGVLENNEIQVVNSCDEFKNALKDSKIVHLMENKCTSDTFSIEKTDEVIFLWIEKGNFEGMGVNIDGAENLEFLIFGDISMSFTGSGSGRRLGDPTKTFQVTNCPKLTSIEIGDGMFNDYTGFTLSNLPSLQNLTIGSSNFENLALFSITSNNLNE